MVEDLLDGQSFGRFQLKHLRDEILGAAAKLDTIRESVVAQTNLVVGGLDVTCFEGRASNQQSVSYHSEAPDVHLV